MSAYRQILYHIVFRTKSSEKTNNQEHSTDSYKELDIIIEYIKNQQEHHKKESFRDEIGRLFK